MTERLLDVENLTVEFKSGGSTMKAVNGVDLQLNKKRNTWNCRGIRVGKKCYSYSVNAFNPLSTRKNYKWKNSL